MSGDRHSGFIRRLNFKRTWGIILDEQEREYYFDVTDVDRDPFSLREGLPVTFHVLPEEHPEAGTDLRATDVQLVR